MAFQFNQGDRPLAGYTIQRGVGRGGFGEVYYATSDGGKEVALKYLRDNPQVELRGATHCLNLKSPYLVALHDIKQSPEGDFFVIMEYVSGPTLRDLMSAEPAGLGPQKAAYFLREIGKGLAYLHDRGIVHRDLKPGNIFYEDGYVKIGDYGLSKMMVASQHSGQTMSVGTVHYMAPEVGSGNYDRTIDIYALGVMLYEMLLGRVPFSGSSMGEVLMKHLTAQPEVDELPEPFPRVIRKALAKDPKERYQSVTEMLSDVFAVEDLNRSVAAFEPASLSAAAARVAKDLNVTVTAGPRGGGGVALGTGSSNVGQHVPPPVIQPEEECCDPRDRFYGLYAERRHAGQTDPARAVGIPQKAMAVAQRPANWFESILLAVITCVGISIGVTLIKGNGPVYGAAIAAHCAAIIGSVLLGLRLGRDRRLFGGVAIGQSLERLKSTEQGSWMANGVAVAVAAMALIMLRRFAPFQALGVHEWFVPVLVCVIFCGWRARFEDGRRGGVSAGRTFSAGFGGLVVGLFLADGDWLPIAGMLAASSMVVQAIGAAWPQAIIPGPRAAVEGAAEREPGTVAAHRAAGAVVISRDGRVAHDGAAGEGSPPGMVAQEEPATKSDDLRSGGVRVAWSIVAGLFMFAMIMTYSATGILDLNEDEFADFIVSGIVLSHAFLFALSCSIPKYRKGLWRGVLRKAIFFGGAAISSGAGASIGLFGLENEDMLAALAGVILGGIILIGVWFVPVAPYLPPAKPPADAETQRWLRQKRWMKMVGGGFLGACVIMTPILLLTVHQHNYDEVLPAVLAPLGVTGITFLALGYSEAQPRPKKRKKRERAELPLRRVFVVDSVSDLDSLLERHVSMYGYTLRNRGDLLWQFGRGDWTAQFWQSDIRRWKTDLTIAAYQRPEEGGYRLTCHLDVDAGFSNPNQSKLRRLEVELDDLQELLGGRALTESGRQGLA